MEEHAAADLAAEWNRERDELQLKHSKLRDTQAFQQELERLDKITTALIEIVRYSWLQSSRHPPILDGLLMYSATDDTLESLIAIQSLVHQGVHNVARRECRYLVELAVKFLFVDQQLPNLSTHTREDRLDFLMRRVPRSSVEPIWDLQIVVGDGHDVTEFRSDVKGLWSRMAGYIHPSIAQTEERLKRAARGAYIGFEDPTAIRAVVAELARAYDQLGAMWLMAAGPSAAGDILTDLEQPAWAFARTKWLPAMSRYFDYKAERQTHPDRWAARPPQCSGGPRISETIDG